MGQPTPSPASGGTRWLKIAAITALVLHSLWLLISLIGTPTTFSHCSAATSACFGGVSGLFAIAAGITGIVLAGLALRIRDQSANRRVKLSWVLLLVAFVLIGVTAGLDVPAAS